MHTKILCTLGPASLNKKVIGRLEDLGVEMFRLNLSHTKIENLQDQINRFSPPASGAPSTEAGDHASGRPAVRDLSPRPATVQPLGSHRRVQQHAPR